MDRPVEEYNFSRRHSFSSPMSKKVLRAMFQYVDKSAKEAAPSYREPSRTKRNAREALGLKFSEGMDHESPNRGQKRY